MVRCGRRARCGIPFRCNPARDRGPILLWADGRHARLGARAAQSGAERIWTDRAGRQPPETDGAEEVRYSVLPAALLALAAHAAVAQNPDLILSKAERDSILKNYHSRFPIWGRKAIEKGFDLPYPVGLSLNVVYAEQDIELSDLGLSTGANPVVPVEFIKFGRVQAPVFTGNLRGDLWLFPFLNLYAFGGAARVSTDVTLTEPVQFNTKVDQNGTYGGLGVTATMGIKRNWLAFDVNWAWTKTENLSEAVKTRIFGIRLGRAQKISSTQRLAYWLGAMKQTLNSGTQGS